MKKAYVKATPGRDYNYDRARGSYSTTFTEMARRKEKANETRRKNLLTRDTDDHGRFSANPDPAVWGTPPTGE